MQRGICLSYVSKVKNMEFLFQIMSDIFSSEEECDEMQMLENGSRSEFDLLESSDLNEDDLLVSNIFAIGEFH